MNLPPSAPQPPPPPAHPGGPAQPGGPVPPAGDQNAGSFFSALFDVEFTHFVALRFIKVIYIVVMVLIALVAMAFLIGALASGEAGVIVGALIFVPIGALLYLIVARISLEVIAVLFRIGENTNEIARRRT